MVAGRSVIHSTVVSDDHAASSEGCPARGHGVSAYGGPGSRCSEDPHRSLREASHRDLAHPDGTALGQG